MFNRGINFSFTCCSQLELQLPSPAALAELMAKNVKKVTIMIFFIIVDLVTEFVYTNIYESRLGK